MLQRRLKLGYSRAARIVDQLEEVGVVGPFEGSKPRQIVMTREQWLQHPLNGGGGEMMPEQINFSEYENEVFYMCIMRLVYCCDGTGLQGGR